MEEIAENDAPFPPPRRRGPDLLNALMLGFTAIFLIATAWLRFGPAPKPAPLMVGDTAPPIHLNDLESGEPVVMVGLQKRLVWLTFWSVEVPKDRTEFGELERVWKALKGERGFSMLISTIATDDPGAVRTRVADDSIRFPVYSATAETCRAFGAGMEELPLHLLIDVDGRILATSRGCRANVFKEFEDLVRSRLKMLDPAGGSRFAGREALGLGIRTGVVAHAPER